MAQEAAAVEAAASVDEPVETRTDPAGFGIDRADPIYAPSPFFGKYIEESYPNVAPEGWKEWEDLPAPFKYYTVKVDPKDVENEGFAWTVFNNWFTAIPASIGLATPLFIWNVIPIDSALEYACIFWFAMAVLYKNAGPAIYDMMSAEVREQKAVTLAAEKAYIDSLADLRETFERSANLPAQMASMNEAERALRRVEASAATRRMLSAEVDKMEAALDFLVSLRSTGAQAETVAAQLGSATQQEAMSRLASDAKIQKAVLNDAIASLGSGADQTGALSSLVKDAAAAAREKLQSAAASAEDAAVQRAKEAAMYEKRFGFDVDTVTQAMIDEAVKDESKLAVLVARCGGQRPQPGMDMYTPNPLAYEK